METPACELFLVYLAVSFATGTGGNYTTKTSKDDQKISPNNYTGERIKC